jgi:hypothetical protein
MRSYADIMSLWPRCGRCEHRAQDHVAVRCTVTVIGRCPQCAKAHVIVQCACPAYVGMTRQEFCDRLLTPDEARIHFPQD